MNDISVIHFDNAVTSIFKPIADRAGLELQKLHSGIYAIAARDFVLRIRLGIGHWKDVLITLAPSKLRRPDPYDLSGEIGINVIAEYQGLTTPEQDLSSAESFYATLRQVAEIAEKACVPYLLGQKSDYDEVRSLIQRKSDEPPQFDVADLPPIVKKKWL